MKKVKTLLVTASVVTIVLPVVTGWANPGGPITVNTLTCQSCFVLTACHVWVSPATSPTRCYAIDDVPNCIEKDRNRWYCNDGEEGQGVGDFLTVTYDYPGSCEAGQWCY